MLGALLVALVPAGAAARVRQAQDILPPGQSGFVSQAGLATGTGSPHLQDQTPLFLKHVFKAAMFGQPATSTESPRAGVTITRDNFGVPDIHGSTTDNLWFGAGYAVAQDRLFQLELFRRATTGHLAEILGKQYVDMDTQVRRDFYTRAELDTQLAALPAALRARFRSVTDGINAWIAQTRTDPSKLPGEFTAVGEPHPANWSVEDSAAIGVYLARTVPSGDGEELNNVRVMRIVGRKLFDRLVPIRDKHQVPTVPRSSGLFPAQPGRTRTQEKAAYDRSRDFATTLALPETNSANGGGGALGLGEQPPVDRRARAPWRLEHVGDSGQGPQRDVLERPAARLPDPRAVRRDRAARTGARRPRGDRSRRARDRIGHNNHVARGPRQRAHGRRRPLRGAARRAGELLLQGPAGGHELPRRADRLQLAAVGHWACIRRSTAPRPSGSAARCTAVQERGGDVAYARRYAIWKHEIGTLQGLAEVNAASSVQQVNQAAAKLTWNENVMAADDQGNIGYWHPGSSRSSRAASTSGSPPRHGQRGGAGSFAEPAPRDHPKQGYLFNWNNVPSR